MTHRYRLAAVACIATTVLVSPAFCRQDKARGGASAPRPASPPAIAPEALHPLHRNGDVWVEATGVWARVDGVDRGPLNAANTVNYWSERQRFSAPVGLTTPFLSIYGAGQTGVDANPVYIRNAIRETPKAVVPNLLNITLCHGNNAAFVGCSGGYFAAGDDDTVTAASKGVLYALALSTRPRVARGDGSPYDDADGLVVSNDGAASGTEAIYLGRNKAIAKDWLAGIGVDASAASGIYFTGSYTYGITFAHGPSARFADGGGVLLVPRPRQGITPIVSVGSDAFKPANNATLAATDSQGNLVVPGSLHLCADVLQTSCSSQRAPLVVESDHGSGITITDHKASGVFKISIASDAGGDLVIDRASGVGGVRFTPPLSAPTMQLAPVTFAALPACNAASSGTMAYITDARAKITTWHQQVTAGAGSNRAFLTCDGNGWFAFSY